MAKVDLTGESQTEWKLFFIPPDAYEGVIMEISDPILTKGYEEGKPKTKTIFTCEISNPKGKLIPLQMWVGLTVTKGRTSGSGKKYSNSKLYDLLNKAGLLDEFASYYKENKQEDELSDASLVKFLKDKFIGKTAKFDVVTSTTKEGKEYSTVKDIKRFLGTGQEDEEDEEAEEIKEIEEIDMTEKDKAEK